MRRAAAMMACVVLTSLIVAAALPVPATAAGVSRLGYVGRVAGTEAFVGVVVRGRDVTAYVCDGRKLARWFQGRLTGDRARLKGRSGSLIELKNVRAGQARGVLRLPGRKALRFTAAAARGRAGLFRAERAVKTRSGRRGRALTGWVRLNGGAIRGASVTSPYRIEHPTSTITVVLEAATDGTISSPTSGPESDERLADAGLPICRWFTGTTINGTRRPLTPPGCGIPRAGIVPSRQAGPTVHSRPGDFPLSQEALALFADRIDDQLSRERAALLRRAGQPDRTLSEAARAKITNRAQTMLKDSRLLTAAESLRRGAPSEVIARTEPYAKLARPPRDQVSTLLPGNDPLVAVISRNGARQVSLPVRRTYVGPWAETSNIVTAGDDWTFDDNSYEICAGFDACPALLNIASAATRVPAHVRAGFNSSITWARAHLLAFDIPANAGRVQVEIDGSQTDLEVETENCFGIGFGHAYNHYMVYEVKNGVVDPFNDTPAAVQGSYLFNDEDDLGLNTDDCLPRISPPVPEAPDLFIVDEADALLEFTAPPAGGSYVVVAAVEAHAEVWMGGTSVSQAALGVNGVTVSHG